MNIFEICIIVGAGLATIFLAFIATLHFIAWCYWDLVKWLKIKLFGGKKHEHSQKK